MIRAPAADNARAVACPIPEPAPVTSAVIPARLSVDPVAGLTLISMTIRIRPTVDVGDKACRIDRGTAIPTTRQSDTTRVASNRPVTPRRQQAATATIRDRS